MQRLEEMLKNRAIELLEKGEVSRVLGWKKGELTYDVEPYVFENEESLKDFTYSGFCGANLSKYLIKESKKEGKILVFLKPCDTYSFNQLKKEHRIKVENVYAIGIECQGKYDYKKLKIQGVDYIESFEEDLDNVTINGKKLVRNNVKLEKCLVCNKKLVAGEEVIEINEKKPATLDRFSMVNQLDNMTNDERYKFFKEQLSKCIRCNACRNVCPACNCTTCIFDNEKSGVQAKANSDSFEEKMFHIIRSFHVAGRCTDCGECSRVCPQDIPLHLLNRKYIKDINRLYGEYQAGEDDTSKGPLTSYSKDDKEPNQVFGGNK